MLTYDARWLEDAISRFDAALHVQGPQLMELRAAGVSSSRLDALYPFDINDYEHGVARLFSDNEGILHAQMVSLSMFDIYDRIGRRLPWPMASRCNELHLLRREGWHDRIPTSRRMVYDNFLMLPLVLRFLRGYPFFNDEEYSATSNRALLQAEFSKFKTCAEQWLDLIEQYMPDRKEVADA